MSKLAAALEAGRPLDDPNVMKEDDPPMLRFERTTLEDRTRTLETGRFAYVDAVKVYIRSYGDIKTEVPDIVKTTIRVPTFEDVMVRKQVPVKVRVQSEDPETGKVTTKEITEMEERDTVEQQATFHEEEITPWFDKLDERLRNGQITQAYRDYCRAFFEKWEQTGDVPLDGTPVQEWNMISEAQKRQLIDAGINTVERCAEMNEDAIEVVGMGARDIKKKAGTYLLAGEDQSRSAARVIALESQKEAQENKWEDERLGYEAKIAELEQQGKEHQERERVKLEEIVSRKGRPTEEMKEAKTKLEALREKIGL